MIPDLPRAHAHGDGPSVTPPSSQVAILPIVGPMTGIVVVAFLVAWLL
jgi:hypothetical protein